MLGAMAAILWVAWGSEFAKDDEQKEWESGPWWHLKQLNQYQQNSFLQNSVYVRKGTPICLSHSESNFPIFTVKTFITHIYWCLSWWASFPLKEGVWPMWANIPFKQDGYIQIKAQEAGNLTANLAPSWCSYVCSVLLGALKPPAVSVVNTASFPLFKGALWYDLLITRPATHH